MHRKVTRNITALYSKEDKSVTSKFVYISRKITIDKNNYLIYCLEETMPI